MQPVETMRTLDEQIAERLGWTKGYSYWFPPGDSNHELGIRFDLLPWSTSREAIDRDLLPRLTEKQWRKFEWKLIGGQLLKRGKAARLIFSYTPEQLCLAWLAATKD